MLFAVEVSVPIFIIRLTKAGILCIIALSFIERYKPMCSAIQEKTNKAWRYVRDFLFYEKTELIYDRKIEDLNYFPTPEQISRQYPNPCGYGTGMEDSMINGSSMLLACIGRCLEFDCPEARTLAHRLVLGILKCQSTARSHGFLPRSVSPADGVSHYIDSSRDQYTLVVFAMHKFLSSGLATDKERIDISKMLTAFAERAEKNATPENGFDMLREDGGASRANVMWGKTLGNHEWLRLPMIYLSAYKVNGDRKWLSLYEHIRREACESSLPMTGSYWHLYSMQQMQMSARLLYDLEDSDEWRESYAEIMHKAAEYTLKRIPQVISALQARQDYNADFKSIHDCKMESKGERADRLPNFHPVREEAESFFVLQDIPDAVTAIKLCPDFNAEFDAEALLLLGLEKINFSAHKTAVPVQFLEAYYTK